jgi:hypothetical protein
MGRGVRASPQRAEPPQALTAHVPGYLNVSPGVALRAPARSRLDQALTVSGMNDVEASSRLASVLDVCEYEGQLVQTPLRRILNGMPTRSVQELPAKRHFWTVAHPCRQRPKDPVEVQVLSRASWKKGSERSPLFQTSLKGWDFCSLPVGLSSQNHPLGVGEPAYSAAYLAGDVLALASHRRRWLAREGNSRRHLSPVAEGAAAPPPGSHSSVRPDRSISVLSELRPKALQGATAAKG